MQEDRMLVGTGDSFYASGIPDAAVEKWHVFRKGKPLKDPATGSWAIISPSWRMIKKAMKPPMA